MWFDVCFSLGVLLFLLSCTLRIEVRIVVSAWLGLLDKMAAPVLLLDEMRIGIKTRTK